MTEQEHDEAVNKIKDFFGAEEYDRLERDLTQRFGDGLEAKLLDVCRHCEHTYSAESLLSIVERGSFGADQIAQWANEGSEASLDFDSLADVEADQPDPAEDYNDEKGLDFDSMSEYD
jgi:hypothetical protein